MYLFIVIVYHNINLNYIKEKPAHVQTLLDYVQKKSKEFYQPRRDIAVDEEDGGFKAQVYRYLTVY